MKLWFVSILSLIAVSLASEAADRVSSPADSSDPLPSKNDYESFQELEKTFYTFPKSTEEHLQQVESKAEKLLFASGNEEDLRDFNRRSAREILALARNYREASKKGAFQDKTRAFTVQLMCEAYADAYKALAKGDFGSARAAMKRARDKRESIRVTFIE